MMSGVNNAEDYYTLMDFDHKDPDTGAPVITNTILQGGIVAVYYLGTLVGALGGGKFSDQYGKIKSIALGAAWAVLGASLQAFASAHNHFSTSSVFNSYFELPVLPTRTRSGSLDLIPSPTCSAR